MSSSTLSLLQVTVQQVANMTKKKLTVFHVKKTAINPNLNKAVVFLAPLDWLQKQREVLLLWNVLKKVKLASV